MSIASYFNVDAWTCTLEFPSIQFCTISVDVELLYLHEFPTFFYERLFVRAVVNSCINTCTILIERMHHLFLYACGSRFVFALVYFCCLARTKESLCISTLDFPRLVNLVTTRLGIYNLICLLVISHDNSFLYSSGRSGPPQHCRSVQPTPHWSDSATLPPGEPTHGSGRVSRFAAIPACFHYAGPSRSTW